jgi:hypothetical protein
LSLSGHAVGSALLPSTSRLRLAAVLTVSLTVAIGTRASTLRLFGFLLGVEALLHLVFVRRRGDQVLMRWTALVSTVIAAPVLMLPAIRGRPVLAAPVWAARALGADEPLSSHARRGPPSI